ncbi:NAD(P)-binding protein [Lepidopterella palustris CBS 459.81]|uniref:NAD(P)-binding protein n=1 Tax=Lepidopterella palustris CBS 459.81 TaxID=1314670 RepID=A0A8E2JAA4_9PEZI|nr:NAD(P)-binding protein [Lepidopterella palustris CBS 459.81]
MSSKAGINGLLNLRSSSPATESDVLTSEFYHTHLMICNALFNLKGRVALVTGGGSGIGLMITQALAVNGAKVYIVGRSEEKLERVAQTYGKDQVNDGEIIPITADIIDKKEIARLYKEISEREKCLCILVNNAGTSGETFESSFDDWERVYRPNVGQIFFLTTAFLPLLQKSADIYSDYSGTVINIASVSGLLKTAQHHFQYNTSKAAAIHLTRILANEVASNRFKIRVNSISPGVFPSEMTTEGSGEDQRSYIPKDQYADKLPAGRPGKDEDIARAVIFLVVEQYIKGQNLVIDGGYSLVAGY